MAESNVNINIKVNSYNAKKDINEFNKSIENTNEVQIELNKTTQKVIETNDNLDNSIKGSTKSNKELSLSLITLANNITTIGIKLGSLAFNNLSEPIKDATNNIKNFAIGLGITATATTATNTIIAKNLLDSFKPLNEEMANVNSILLETPQNFTKLNEKVRDLSLSMKLASETQIAKGLYDVASSGYQGADALKVMDVSIRTSKAGRADLRDSSMLIAQSLNAMGKSADYAEHFANVFFKTVQRGVVELPDLARNSGKVTSTLNTLGQSIEVLGASISILTRKGTLPEQAFTNFNSLLLSFSAMSETAKEKAFELGIQIDANAIKTKGLGAVINEMVTAAKNTDDLEGTLFTLLGRQEALDAALKLSNAEEFKQEMKEFSNVSTSLSDSLAEQTKSLTAQLEEVKNGFEAVKTEAGGMIGTFVSNLLPAINSVIDDFNSLSEAKRKSIMWWTGLLSIIPAVITAFGATVIAIGLLIAHFTLTQFVMGVIISKLPPLISLITSLSLVLKNAAVAFYSFASGTTAGSTALATLRASLLTTMSAMSSSIAIIGSAVIAIGALTKATLDLDKAQEEQRKNEERNYEAQEEAIKKIAQLRKKEKSGVKLTAEEQKEYAHALVNIRSIGEVSQDSGFGKSPLDFLYKTIFGEEKTIEKYSQGTEKKLKQEAMKRIGFAKKLEKEQKKEEQKNTGPTDEQKENKKALFSSLSDEEMSLSEDTRRKAKYDADKWRIEELDKVSKYLKVKTLTEEEAQKAILQINNIYNGKLLKAESDFQEKQKQIKEKAQKEYETKIKKQKQEQSDNQEKFYNKKLSNLDNQINTNNSNFNDGKISLKTKTANENKYLSEQKNLYRDLLSDSRILADAKEKYLTKESELTQKISSNSSTLRKQSLKDKFEEEKKIIESSIRTIEKEKELHNTSNTKYYNDLAYAQKKHKERLELQLKDTSQYSDERRNILEEIKRTELNIDDLLVKKQKESINERLKAIEEYNKSIKNFNENEYNQKLNDIDIEKQNLQDSFRLKEITKQQYVEQLDELLEYEKNTNDERLNDFKISENEREKILKRQDEIDRERYINQKELIHELNEETAKSLTNSFGQVFDNIIPGISRVFDEIIDKNKDLRDELLKTFGLLKVPNIDVNSNAVTGLLSTSNNTPTNKDSTPALPKALKYSSGALQDFYKKTQKSFNKIPLNFELPTNELKAVESSTGEINKNVVKGSNALKDFGESGAGVTFAFDMASKSASKMIDTLKTGINDLRNSTSEQETIDSLNVIGEGFTDAITGGLTGSISKTLGIKTKQELKEEQKRIRDLKTELSGNKNEVLKNNISDIQKENISDEEKALKSAIVMKQFTNLFTQHYIANKKVEASFLKDKSRLIEENYNIEVMEANLIDDNLERSQRLKQAEINKTESLKAMAKEKREVEISLETDREKQLKMIYDNEIQNINDTVLEVDTAEKKKLEAKKKYEKELADYKIVLARLIADNEAINDDEATQYIKKYKIDLQELDSIKEDSDLKEQKRIKFSQELVSNLKRIREDAYKNLESIMSKYYDKELKAIKKNHKAEYDSIQINENKIKDNQKKIDELNYQLDKINKEFDKKLENKALSKEASIKFKTDRDSLLNGNNGVDLANLLRLPPSEFERMIASKKEDIEATFTVTGDNSKRADDLKVLAVQQNVFYSELSKGIVKNTKEYDKYIKLANDGFKEYKEAIKDSIEVEKENKIVQAETKDGVIDLRKEIDKLSSENTDLAISVTRANNSIQSDIDAMTTHFKESSGEWIKDFDDARKAVSMYSEAIQELNKLEIATKTVNQTLPTLLKDTNAPVSNSNLKVLTGKTNDEYKVNTTQYTNPNINKNGIAGALSGETEDQTIARIKKEDAEIQKQNIASYVGSKIANAFKKTPQLSSGGLVYGPTEGYLATLHGKELVLNQKQGDNLANVLYWANNPPNKNVYNNQSQVFAPVIHINGTQLSETQLTKAINNALDQQRINKNNSY